MLGPTPIEIGDERGTTMVELLVGMAMGMIVLAALTTLLIVVLHGNARVDARVEATDNARLAVTRITEELHSACYSPQIAPVQPGSDGNTLIFRHAATSQDGAVEPTPVESTIAYDPDTGELLQTDGAGPPRTLLTNVSPAGPEGVFSYYSGYDAAGEPDPISTAEDLDAETAATVVAVQIALTAAPRSTPVADPGAAATVQDTATLRLTPPPSKSSSDEETSAGPCE